MIKKSFFNFFVFNTGFVLPKCSFIFLFDSFNKSSFIFLIPSLVILLIFKYFWIFASSLIAWQLLLLILLNLLKIRILSLFITYFSYIEWVANFNGWWPFLNFWLCRVFIFMCGLSLVAVSGGYSLLWSSTGFVFWCLLLWDSGCRTHGLSNCSSQA